MRRKIIFVQLHSEALGHLVRDTEIVLHNISSIENEIDTKLLVVFYTQKEVANKWFVSLLRRKYLVLPHSLFSLIDRIYSKISPNYRLIKVRINNKDLLFLNHIHGIPNEVPFTDQEKAMGEQLLSRHLTQSYKGYVCICIRDDGFDKTFHDQSRIQRQNYRNFHVNTMLPLIKTLNESGYFVIRMGRHSSTRLLEEIPGYYDYSSDTFNHKDFLDFYLFSKCRFVVSTGTGIDEIGAYFRKRIYILNAAPPLHIPTSHIYPISLIPDYISLKNETKLSISQVLDPKIGTVNPYFLQSEGIAQIVPKRIAQMNDFLVRVLTTEEIISRNERIELPREITALSKVSNTFSIDSSKRFIY